jgi:uncharacterized DUF497 family protein
MVGHCARPWAAEQDQAQPTQLDLHCFCGYNKKMRVTYDPAKSSRNEELRGLSFTRAKDFDWGRALIAEDTREDYSEKRFQALGHLDEHLHMLVFTLRDGAVHVISLRRANRRERTRYAAQTQP